MSVIKKIPILAFHSLDDDRSPISFPPALFAKILTKLKRKGYRSISASDVVSWINGNKSFNSPVLVISFDDGFENLYSTAFPLLADLGFNATIFLTTGYCGLKNDWPSQPNGIPQRSILRWDQIKEMSKSVFEIQAHSITHPYLSQQSAEVIENELIGSKRMIEDKLGKPVEYFAYPYGDYNDLVYEMVALYYQGACSAKLDFAHWNSDSFLLERIDMYYFSYWITARLFHSSFFVPYLWLRKMLRNLRAQQSQALRCL